jgi:uncharacterized protein (DUF427 family)
MTRAIWKGAVLAESDRCERLEGQCYFPPDSVNAEFLRPSETHTMCGRKGTASYYDVVVGDEVNTDAAWYYPDTKPAATNIRGYIAFWRGVEVK